VNTCPKCNSTLPDWVQQCQFCGSAVMPKASPNRYDAPRRSNYAYGIAPWVWVTYYTISGWFVLSGLYTLTTSVIGLVQFNARTANMADAPFMPPVHALGFVFYVMMALALAGISVGVGLLLQNDFMKGIANYYCMLMALGGIYSFFVAMALPIHNFTRIILISRSGLDIVCGLLMLYLIFETNDNSGF
jgi:hypothetical protein